jgi:hypothetical protein
LGVFSRGKSSRKKSEKSEQNRTVQKTVAIEIWIELKERQEKHGENTFGKMGVGIWGCGSEEKVERGMKNFSHKGKEISQVEYNAWKWVCQARNTQY